MAAQEDWPAARDWTIDDIITNLLYPNGHRAFMTPTSGRSWVKRQRDAGRLKHHPTRRVGPKDARVYDRDKVLALWYKGHLIPKAAKGVGAAHE